MYQAAAIKAPPPSLDKMSALESSRYLEGFRVFNATKDKEKMGLCRVFFLEELTRV